MRAWVPRLHRRHETVRGLRLSVDNNLLETRFEQLFHSNGFWGTVPHIEHTFGHRGLRDHSDWRVTMTATMASTARSSVRTSAPNGDGVRVPTRVSPTARPSQGGSVAPGRPVRLAGRSATASSCRVVSPVARRSGLVLKLKVAAVAVVAVVSVALTAAEFSTWSQPDPAVDYVAGDAAWAHVTGD